MCLRDNLFVQYFNSIYDFTLTSVILCELHHLKADLTHFICLYITNILGHAQIYTNDYFSRNSFSATGGYFQFSLLYIEDNIWGRAPMVYLLSCWDIRRLMLWYCNISIYRTLSNRWTAWGDKHVIFSYSRYIYFRYCIKVYLFVIIL